MLGIIFYGGIVLAFFIVWVEYKCAVSNKKFYVISTSMRWNRMYKWRYLIAFLLVPMLLLEYPVYADGEHYKILGFPLLSAVFDSKGRDFVSAITGMFLVVDAVIIYFSIHIIICLLRRWTNDKIK